MDHKISCHSLQTAATRVCTAKDWFYGFTDVHFASRDAIHTAGSLSAGSDDRNWRSQVDTTTYQKNLLKNGCNISPIRTTTQWDQPADPLLYTEINRLIPAKSSKSCNTSVNSIVLAMQGQKYESEIVHFMYLLEWFQKWKSLSWIF